MASDNLEGKSYSAFMAEGQPFIRICIEFQEPIELGNFVAAFTSLSGQYDKFIKTSRPDLAADADLFVKEVRAGSIEVDLLPWIVPSVAGALALMDQIMTVDSFVRIYGAKILAYIKPGGRAADVGKSDLKEIMGAVKAIAADPDASSRIEAVYYENGKEQVKTAIRFNTQQARVAEREVQAHMIEIESKSSADHNRVLMTFSQSNIKTTEPGKRTGERVVIAGISPQDLPLIYASDMAEQRIKHEITEADDNVFKKGFVVDANVETRNGKPVAYRVTNVHQVIDLPD
jgi:hypothetical protein